MKLILSFIDLIFGNSEITKNEWLAYSAKCLKKNNISEWAGALNKVNKF